MLPYNHTYFINRMQNYISYIYLVSIVYFLTRNLLDNNILFQPIGIVAIDPWGQPLLGTSILQASGFILTEGHEALRSGDKAYALLGFLLSILQGQAFLFLQYTEYITSGFTIADNAFGTTFYMLTGLHFQHVQVGVIMLTVAMFRIKNDEITITHAQGIDFAIYYWHLYINTECFNF